ncbi:hypothetical protein CEY16_11460 [Halalkalibacillus sediminis]|uniref:DUF3298 domain-containing protein n=1 Tax=Halalkalibacillus sediminis TaxID=2018042 RepID=A0A2I0QSM9_9BACI|nr:DUF3298 and DUF4163 domain-containing protein [Halalkalibacillus sediminis]PKR77343.1 hypothetical protein CEY16_11460 [Halalkalibacillus sediminis]
MAFSLPVHIATVSISKGPNQTVLYPQVLGMQNKEVERSINQVITNENWGLIELQEGGMPTPVVDMVGQYEIKNNQREVLSLSLSNYTYHYHAAHGTTYIKSLTFGLDDGKLYSLGDLFMPGSDYVERISELVQLQIEERDISLVNGFTRISPDQDFYIADKALVIYYQLYEITAYVFGFPMFPISVYDLQDIIDKDGPLGQMVINN